MSKIGLNEAMVRFNKSMQDLTEVFKKFRAEWDAACNRELLARKRARAAAMLKQEAYSKLPYEEKLRLARIADERMWVQKHDGDK